MKAFVAELDMGCVTTRGRRGAPPLVEYEGRERVLRTFPRNLTEQKDFFHLSFRKLGEQPSVRNQYTQKTVTRGAFKKAKRTPGVYVRYLCFPQHVVRVYRMATSKTYKGAPLYVFGVHIERRGFAEEREVSVADPRLHTLYGELTNLEEYEDLLTPYAEECISHMLE